MIIEMFRDVKSFYHSNWVEVYVKNEPWLHDTQNSMIKVGLVAPIKMGRIMSDLAIPS